MSFDAAANRSSEKVASRLFAILRAEYSTPGGATNSSTGLHLGTASPYLCFACFRNPPNRAPRPPEALDGLCAPGSRVPLSVEAGFGFVGDPSKREPMLVNLWDHDSVRIKDPLGLVVEIFRRRTLETSQI